MTLRSLAFSDHTGAEGYGGPHPPRGDDPHRYFFRLYALLERAGLPPGFSAQDPGPFLDGAPAKATLVGTFGTFGR